MKEAVPVLRSYKVGEEVLDLEYLLNAPFEDISEAAEKIPAAIGWLGYQRGLANERLINSEHAWKCAESKAYFALRAGLYVSEGFGEKVTEDGLKRALLLQPDVTAAVEDYANRKRHVDWLTASIDALRAKLDLVRSSETTRRLEHERDRGSVS